MLHNIFPKITLATALLIAGLNSAAAGDSSYGGVSSQPTVIAAHTSEKGVLRTKGIQYRPGPSGRSTYRLYQLNDSKKAHRPVKTKSSYGTDEISRPNHSRKLRSGGRTV